MKSKRFFQVMTATLIVLSLCTPVIAGATIMPFADPVFSSAFVTLKSGGVADFVCNTVNSYNSVTLKSVSYQYKDGSKWVNGGSLSKPTNAISSSSAYAGTTTYSLPSGKTCRLVAVFSADSYTITKYSGQVSF